MYRLTILCIGFLFFTDVTSINFVKFETFNNGTLFQIKTKEESRVRFNVSLTYSWMTDEQIRLKCWMDYSKVGVMINWTDKVLPVSVTENSTLDFYISILGKRLGGSKIVCSLFNKTNSTSLHQEVVGLLIVSRVNTVHELIFRIIITIFVIAMTFVMGCGLDYKIIIGYFKKPLSPSIGFISQFLFMPLISGGLGKFSGIDNAFALGLLVIGCSPGGGASNIWTVLFGGDLNLSMTMTFISTVSALGMMPFWLFILGRMFVDPQILKIPYDNIAINLLLLVIPAGLGIAFRLKWEDKSNYLMKKLKLLAVLFIIYVFTYGTYVNLYAFKLFEDYLYLLPIGAFLPWLGFIFGFLLALIFRRNKFQAIAISLETGFQNIGIGILILKYSMPQPDGDLGSVMPLIVAIFTPFPLYIGFIIMTIKNKFFKKSEKEKTVKYSPDKDQAQVLLDTLPN